MTRNENTCVGCGASIPEGTHVCSNCMVIVEKEQLEKEVKPWRLLCEKQKTIAWMWRNIAILFGFYGLGLTILVVLKLLF